MAEPQNVDQHFAYDVRCRDCQWVGFTADMMVSGRKPKPYCPKCESMNLDFVQTAGMAN